MDTASLGFAALPEKAWCPTSSEARRARDGRTWSAGAYCWSGASEVPSSRPWDFLRTSVGAALVGIYRSFNSAIQSRTFVVAFSRGPRCPGPLK
jgi:hypothetical protein